MNQNIVVIIVLLTVSVSFAKSSQMKAKHAIPVTTQQTSPISVPVRSALTEIVRKKDELALTREKIEFYLDHLLALDTPGVNGAITINGNELSSYQDASNRKLYTKQKFQLVPAAEQSLNSILRLYDHNTLLSAIDELKDFSIYDSTAAGSGSLVYQLNEPNFTPMTQVEDYKALVDPIETFDRKMQILTGSSLGAVRIARADMQEKIDFSKMPFYDEILISTLFLRSDYSGRNIAAALKEHASRGTKIKIMQSQAALRGLALGNAEDGKKDQALVDELIRDGHGNIEIQNVQYMPTRIGENHPLSTLQIAHHTKIMIFYSRSVPALNRVIVGGRNLSDAYVFKKAPDHSANKAVLVQYKPEAFLATEDIDLEIQSAELAQSTRAQYVNFWNRTQTHFRYKAPYTPLNSSQLSNAIKTKFQMHSKKTVVRHFWSTPYTELNTSLNGVKIDDATIEDVFVHTISSAKRSIKIVSPYFNLTEKLEKALIEAGKRNVSIELISNIDMKGDDFAPAAVTYANRRGMSRVADYAQMYTWQEPGIMLHAKFMLVDDEFLYLGSINFNRRSFIFDFENGYMMNGGSVVSKMVDLYENHYRRSARKMSLKEVNTFKAGVLLKTGMYLLGDFF